MLKKLREKWQQEIGEQWPRMTIYERFEQVVALILSILIMVVIVVALIELTGRVVRMLLLGALDPLEHEVFQNVFGAIMTLLIAMEFKHSIVRVVERRDSIIQVKTVVLIAILALTRKFIIIDVSKTGADVLFALAGVVLALGVVYWLMRERDDRLLALQSQKRSQHDGRPRNPG